MNLSGYVAHVSVCLHVVERSLLRAVYY